MSKLREKWLVALLLAILLHVAVFFIFYLNLDNDTNINTNNDSALSEQDVAEQMTTLPQPDPLPPLKTQMHTAILEESRIPTKENKRLQTPLEDASQSTPIASDTPVSEPKASHDDRLISPKASETLVKQTLRKKTDTEKQGVTDANIAISNEDAAVEAAIKNAGLLAGDVPIQETRVEMDKDYQKMKSEVEEANNKLSDAINEVKKRNQQKIDNRRQRNDSAESYVESAQPNNE
ncbi:secreted protein [marine sediment metagenome]|uniref:Secreted protein n=1 Tax=marine sediment metagenome TaxID=412755 RepID=A0A1B6NYE3_9ZZZZ